MYIHQRILRREGSQHGSRVDERIIHAGSTNAGKCQHLSMLQPEQKKKKKKKKKEEERRKKKEERRRKKSSNNKLMREERVL